jgi:hypothetical protein
MSRHPAIVPTDVGVAKSAPGNGWRRRAWRALPALVFMLLACGQAAAQPAQPCADGRISHIFIDNNSVFDLAATGDDTRFRWAYRTTNRMHVRTRPAVILRELFFTEGDCYDPELLRESERVLRATPFIADADVFGIRQEDGSYHVVVQTRDDWSFHLEPQLGRGDEAVVTGVRVREFNLMGTGRTLSAHYLREYDRPAYGVAFATPQLLNTRWTASAAVARTPVGQAVAQSLTYPFVGELGRWAFRQQVRYHDRYFEYYGREQGERFTMLLPERRLSFDVGGVRRLGERGRLTLLGAGVVGDGVRYPDEPRRVVAWRDAYTLDPAIADTVGFGLKEIESVRALLLIGQRNVRFARRRALDTVRGTEDVRVGAEVETAIGHTIPLLSRDRAVSLDFGIFAAGEPTPGAYAGVRFNAELHRAHDAPAGEPEWRDALAQADAWAYWRPHDESRQTLVASVRGSGGWNTRMPYQLTLGGGAGLRGYWRHVDPGAARVVASLEHRAYWGWPLPELFDLGSVVFLDAGRIWANGVPFAQQSSYRANLGFGLRSAFPPGSRQTLRLDVGVPIEPHLQWRDVVVRAGIGQAIGVRSVAQDPQLLRSSRRGLPVSVFNFPD